jgi:hypothetical protein
MSIIPVKLQSFLEKPQTKTAFLDIIGAMRLFPEWASSYWCHYIIQRPEIPPVELIQQSPFSSFFFRPCSTPAFISPLYMRIWGGVHLAHYIYHRDSDAVAAFIVNNTIPEEFTAVLENLQPCKVGQGDWKCDDCGPVPGYTNVCPHCETPCKSWCKHVFSICGPAGDPVGEID